MQMKQIYSLESHFFLKQGTSAVYGKFLITDSGKIYGRGRMMKLRNRGKLDIQKLNLHGRAEMLEDKVHLLFDFSHELNFVEFTSLNGATLSNPSGDYVGEYHNNISGTEYFNYGNTGQVNRQGSKASATIQKFKYVSASDDKVSFRSIYLLLKNLWLERKETKKKYDDSLFQ
jgi:hypothetical protein